MKRIFSLMLLSALLLFAACKKDNTVASDAQVNATRLKQELAKTSTIISISVYDLSSFSFLYSGSTYSITSDNYILITNVSTGTMQYYLGDLKAFRVNGDLLGLYF